MYSEPLEGRGCRNGETGEGCVQVREEGLEEGALKGRGLKKRRVDEGAAK